MPKVTIKGLPELTRKLKKIELEKWKVVMRVVNKYVDLMVAEARANAPVDRGVTRDSIQKEVKSDFSISFFVGTAYGAIQEFGTGLLMEIPPELEQDALQFKGYKSGDFKSFVKEIEEWCVRKGIDPEAAYPIAASILNEGLKPQPFFYPAFKKYKDAMILEAQAELDKLVAL